MSEDVRVLNDLAAQLADAKEAIMGARANANLTNLEAQQAITAVARALQLVNAAIVRASAPPGSPLSQPPAPLSEFFLFPNERVACPKCGNKRPGTRSYRAEGVGITERIKHTCACGYAIYTKPLGDASKDF